MKVAFLFNHEALHQVRHTAPVAAALASSGEVAVHVLCSNAAQQGEARALVGAAANITFGRLDPGPIAAAFDRALRAVGPFRRLAVLWHNRRRLGSFDALVVPETTTMMLRDRFGVTHPRMVWIPHGAGDRSVGFRSVARRFDLVLVAGRKIYDRMVAQGVVTRETCRVVGYPKFDTIDPAAPLAPLFDNGRPTVVYNPHFDPRLSSWYAMGEQVLEWFAGQDRFNLIFAPHVMLFRRRIHASVEHRLVRWRRDLDARMAGCPHILIDTGSVRSTDMTYTRSADIYLGDASSQIYEWIARPRPAIFLNPSRLSWRGDENFAHWNLGEVVEDIPHLSAALNRAVADPGRFDDAQRQAFAYTFSVEERPASERAALAIRAMLAMPASYRTVADTARDA